MELAAGYAPQNWYCYSLDAKADKLFKERMHNLTNCFPNVFIAKKEFVVYRKGVNMDASFLECMKELLNLGINWKYLLLLQVFRFILIYFRIMIQLFELITKW